MQVIWSKRGFYWPQTWKIQSKSSYWINILYKNTTEQTRLDKPVRQNQLNQINNQLLWYESWNYFLDCFIIKISTKINRRQERKTKWHFIWIKKRTAQYIYSLFRNHIHSLCLRTFKSFKQCKVFPSTHPRVVAFGITHQRAPTISVTNLSQWHLLHGLSVSQDISRSSSNGKVTQLKHKQVAYEWNLKLHFLLCW